MKKDKNQEFINKLKFIPLLFLPMVLFAGLIYAVINNISTTDDIKDTVTNDDSYLSQNDYVNITFKAGSNSQLTLKAEVAATQAEREQGLMDRQYLEWNSGMLFVLEREQIVEFWMKNTYIPLDIIFMNVNKEIIKIHKNTQPLDTSIHYSSGKAAKYGLEVNAGWSDANNIKEGDKVYF
jgi:uncharacterized protein